MDAYTHYGIDVIRQCVNDFRAELKKQGVAYIDLAIAPKIDVVKYTKDGKAKYALIRPLNYPDDYAELVYITTQTPDDCEWGRLAADVEAQHEGDEPMRRQTKVKMLLEAAEEAVWAEAEEQDEANMCAISDCAQREEDWLQDAIKMKLADWGISIEKLKEMEHYDVHGPFLELF